MMSLFPELKVKVAPLAEEQLFSGFFGNGATFSRYRVILEHAGWHLIMN